ncbi:hypothetical protein RJ640_019344 [Escallonia rubra]|uniref:Uncharacterized protein n=1 Tax=Escallonia rubra TaxID=112253 RepID=A0AA88RUQ5_9ASTE|nr:hypothetical protein RJ640_019344 [Escallonia rubra]
MLRALLELPEDLVLEMMEPPRRSYDPLLIQDPAIYRQNEIIQGDVRKALSKHLIGLRNAKLINLQAIFGPLLQPFIPSIPIQEVADALVSSFGHLFCSPPFNSLQPLLQSHNLSKMIFLLLAQLFSTMGGLLCLLNGFPFQLSLLGRHLPCHLKVRKHLRSASVHLERRLEPSAK